MNTDKKKLGRPLLLSQEQLQTLREIAAQPDVPTYDALAVMFGVSRNTIARALRRLRAQA